MKQLLAAALCACLLVQPAAAVTGAPEVEAGSAVLMEKETGAVLYEANAHDKLEPASVTKVMTLLLVMEALDAGRIQKEDLVTVSARAASMGGSQVYLKEGEQMTVDDMLKAVAVVSGNDAAVALAEHYTTIWMDTIRDGQFQLANTNKLVRYYEGCTGLKTGSTDSALYCLSATAEREGMELIAVVMKSPTSAQRFESAKAMLTFGFANYTLVDVRPGEALPPVDVALGVVDQVQPVLGQSSRILVDKSQINEVTTAVRLTEGVEAPVEAGQKLGELVVSVAGEERQTIPLVAAQAVERITLPGIFLRLLEQLFMAG